jgi:UDP-3-O-[3-hydroxymyristoyl] glucosamine N-acyltransferase
MADSRFFLKKESIDLKDIASMIGASSLEGNLLVQDVCSMEEMRPDCISFIKHKKYLDILEGNKSTAFIVQDSLRDLINPRSNILFSKNPEVDFVRVTRAFYETPFLRMGYEDEKGLHVSPTVQLGKNVQIMKGAVIGAGAEIGDNTWIGPNAVIGPHVVIGKDSEIHGGASIMCALMGHSVVVHPNAVIGSAGFGFIPTETGMLDIPQIGRVIVGDDVHIGASCAIDRGGLKDTVIGSHSRLDNLVQIGHNVRIGRGCVIVSQVGIAGSTEIGDFSMIGGQVGIADHLKIGKGVKLAAKSGVMRDIEDGAVMGGSPALPIKQWHRTNIALAKLGQ